MMIKIFSILLVITSGILCSGTQQGISSTQSGQTLQIQPNVRKYNKHTSTEKPCTTGSTTGTRKDKPDGSEAQADYAPAGGPAVGAGYAYPYPPYPYPYPPYPYPYPYPTVGHAPAGVVLVPGGGPAYRPPPQQYPYEPQYAADAAQYYAPPYYPAAGPTPPPPYYAAAGPTPPPYYAAPPPPYPPASQSPYEQSVVVDAYRSPQPEQQFFRQPAAAAAAAAAGAVPPHYNNNNNNNNNYVYGPPPHLRAQAYGRPVAATQSFLLQQRDAAAAVTPATNAASAGANGNGNAEQQYEQQQSGPLDGNQFHY